jgi:CRISPR/Cas system-associated exonuclease Cas4 (RecB family)
MILDDPKPWKRSSPSQVSSFRRCPRRWWYDKIAGLPRPKHPAAELGERVHAVAERYLLGELEIPKRRGKRLQGADGEALRIFAPGRRFLPKPPIDPEDLEFWVGNPGVCEPWKHNPEGCALDTEVVPLVGRVDLYVPSELLRRGTFVDHKTTSDERWMRSPEELAEDPQAAVYTRLALSDGPAGFRHVYYLTRGRPRSFMSEVTITRAISDRVFGGVVETLAKMQPLSLEAEDRAVPQNKAACRDYGGCPYAHVCRRSRAGRPGTERIEQAGGAGGEEGRRGADARCDRGADGSAME